MFSGSVRQSVSAPRGQRLSALLHLTFRQSPRFPEILHEIFQVFEAEHALVESLAVEGLRETPARVDSATG